MSRIRTLAMVVGGAVALALGSAVPMYESGRTVDASIDAQGALVVKHVSGPQYLKAYLDVAGVATACDGLTRDESGRPIKSTASFTEAQCAAMLERALVAHADGAMACTPSIALSPDPVIERSREGPRFAAVDHAYHFGVAAWCGSTARRQFDAGNFLAGCDALLPWNKARVNGKLRVLPGLKVRQAKDRRVCVFGLGALNAPQSEK